MTIDGRRLGPAPILGLLLTGMVLTACAGTELEGPAPPPPPPPPAEAAGPSGVFIVTPFKADDFAWSVKPGSARIQGLTDPRASCAGKTVALTPVTAYSRERIRALYGSTTYAVEPMAVVRSRNIVNDNPAMRGYVRAARCEANGTFVFDKIPAGNYFIISEINDPSGAKVIMRQVTAVAGRTLQAPLNGSLPPAPKRKGQ